MSTIQLVSSKGDAFQLYGQKVSGDPTNINGYYTYQLPNNLSTIYPDTYQVNLVSADGKPEVRSNKFSVLSPTTAVPPSSSKYSIAGVAGQQQTYAPGASITFSVKGIEPDGTPASQQKGFNVQAHLYNQNVKGMNPSFQAVNGTYNTSSGYWDVKLTAPSDVTIPYEVKISLYCGYVGFDSICAQKYGASSAQYQTFQFRVINTSQPSITVLSPNGGEVWPVGSTQVIKWNNTSGGPVNLTLSNYLSCWNTEPACMAPAVLYQLANNVSGSTYNWTTGKTASGGDIPAGEYKVTVSSATSGSVTDQSDSAFTITPPVMTDTEIITALEGMVRAHPCNFLTFSQGTCNLNYDFNNDNRVDVSDENLMRNVRTLSDSQFDIIYKKIDAEFRARDGASKGTAGYLEVFDPNRDGIINDVDWGLIKKAIVGTRVYPPTPPSITSLNPQTVQALAEFSQKKNLNLASILAAIAQLIEAFK